MRRQLTATAATLAAATLLLVGCSGDSGTTAPDTTTPAPASSAAASDSAASDSAASDSAASDSAAPGSTTAAVPASPELTAWASQFCTASAGIGEIGNVAQPTEQQLADPTATKAFVVELYTTYATVFQDSAGKLGEVGPPPLGGQEGFTDQVVTAFTSAGQTYQDLADQAAAVDINDPAAVGGLATGLQDLTGPIASAFAPLQDNPSPELDSALTTTPECAAIGG